MLAGDLQAASDSHAAFFWVWQQFGALPERYLYSQGIPHPTEHYYPLRPELLESTFYLHQVACVGYGCHIFVCWMQMCARLRMCTSAGDC